MSLEEGRKMTKNINDMTNKEFNNLLSEIKERAPKLFLILTDFVNKKFSSEEVDNLLSMNNEDQLRFINGYQARA
jgi:raw score 4.52